MNAEVIVAQIKLCLESMRPAIQTHGGDIEFVSFEKGQVLIKMHGTCVGCPISTITIKQGIERQLKEQIPAVTSVSTIQ